MFTTIVGIHSINISESGNQIDTFQVTNQLSDGSLHVGPACSWEEFQTIPQMIDVAYIVQISGSTNGDFVDQLTYHIPPNSKHISVAMVLFEEKLCFQRMCDRLLLSIRRSP